LYMMLGLNPNDLAAPSPNSPFPPPRIILCTSRLSCIFCPTGDINIVPTLRRRVANYCPLCFMPGGLLPRPHHIQRCS
jgi:hypothetical protein